MDAKVMKEILPQQGDNVAYFYFPNSVTGKTQCVTGFTPQMVLFGAMAGSRTLSTWLSGEMINAMSTDWESDRVTFYNTSFEGYNLVLIAFG